jgi:hypothetical protein
MTELTIFLPDETYQRLEKYAEWVGQSLENVITHSVEFLPDVPVNTPDMIDLSDEDVLALASLEMEAAQDQRLSHLLDRQQAGTLSDAERIELSQLMSVYKIQLLRKSQGQREAVRRGLLNR